jgi:hypothetical protein
MPNRFFTPASLATLIGLTTATSAQTGAMTSEQGWSAITRCSQEETERARHTCVDRVLRDAGLLTNEMRAKQQQRAFGLDNKPARTPEPAPAPSTASAPSTGAPIAGTPSPAAPSVATSPAPSSARATTPAAAASTPSAATSAASANDSASRAAAASPAPAAEPPDRVDVQLTKVVKAPNGRLVVTTSDGAVWLQTEAVSMPLPPAAGDRMSIRKATLGGYVCSVADTHLTYRCSRSR